MLKTEASEDIATTDFKGPLFVVGLPRSGTKLLRDLLNQNRLIGIPTIESHFIPGFIKKYDFRQLFASQNEERRIYQSLIKTVFVAEMAKKGVALTEERFLTLTGLNLKDKIASLFAYYAQAQTGHQALIWGDKTPGYHMHMKTLKETFPEAKFIHIIRDPRDCCLSMRKAWGKNILRSAHRWNREVVMSQAVGATLGDSYTKIRYEDLLNDPPKVMQSLCDFVGRAYSSSMTSLLRPCENIGDARERKVVISNQGKYSSGLTANEIRRVEEIAYIGMKQLGYVCKYAKGPRKLGVFAQLILRSMDALNALGAHIKDRGMLGGFRHAFRFHSDRQP